MASRFTALLLLMHRIKRSEIEIEKLRHSCCDAISDRLAEFIDNKGGMGGQSKSAKRAKRMSTKEGISAIMSRWFLIQELYGVLLIVVCHSRQTQTIRSFHQNPKRTSGYVAR